MLPCNSVNLQSNENGFLYFETRDYAGNTFESGVFTNTGRVIDPYLAGFGGLQLNNAAARYTCDTYLGILGGLVTPAVMGQSPIYYVAIGTVNNYNPANAFLPSETITESNAAWIFAAAPSQYFNEPGIDATGIDTPCTGCSISKVTSIGQYGDNSTFSSFGIDPTTGDNAIQWNELTFGQWQAGCQQGSMCTIEYSTNSAYWYAGEENYPNPAAANALFSANGAVFESYDGVVANFTSQQSKARKPDGAFKDPLPPRCTPDSYGYCQVEIVSSPSFGTVGACHNQPIFGYIGSGTLVIQTQRDALLSFTETWHFNGGTCKNVGTWTPSEPKVLYGDPNLP